MIHITMMYAKSRNDRVDDFFTHGCLYVSICRMNVFIEIEFVMKKIFMIRIG